MARFSATGFEAAAVTAMADGRRIRPNCQARRPYSSRWSRPFGFIAVHRPTGVPVVAGWVAGA